MRVDNTQTSSLHVCCDGKDQGSFWCFLTWHPKKAQNDLNTKLGFITYFR